mmetsp:Transcript_5801/g.6354  ORF Transcript_5801/g.6354 Transcript_5801/m.6354 type:complete len:249 (-) Transcript_5801:163-909(-)
MTLKKRKKLKLLQHCYQKVNPRNGEVAYTLGMLYYNQYQQQQQTNHNQQSLASLLRQAKECFHMCLELNPYDVEAMMGVAQISNAMSITKDEIYWNEQIVLLLSQSGDEAQATTNKKIKKTLMASACSNLGTLRPEIEIQYYQKALQYLQPDDNFQLRYSLGSAHASRQKYQLAIESYKSALLVLVPNHHQYHHKKKTLQNLYRVSFHHIQTNLYPNGFTSQEQMITALKQVMGEINYQQLVVSTTNG